MYLTLGCFARHVQAVDGLTKRSAEVVISNNQGRLSKSEIERMLHEEVCCFLFCLFVKLRFDLFILQRLDFERQITSSR
jgi:hypothetical protein